MEIIELQILERIENIKVCNYKDIYFTKEEMELLSCYDDDIETAILRLRNKSILGNSVDVDKPLVERTITSMVKYINLRIDKNNKRDVESIIEDAVIKFMDDIECGITREMITDEVFRILKITDSIAIDNDELF